MSGDRNNSDGSLTGRVHRTAQDLQRTIENLSVDGIMDGVAGEAVGSGYRGNATLMAHSHAGAGSDSRREREERQKELRRAIQAAIGRMDARIAGIDARRRDIADMLDGVGEVIDTINDDKGVELDDEGNLKNKAAEKALREYEKRTGTKVDRTDPDAVLEAMIIIQAELEREDRDLARKRDRIADAKNKVRDQTSTEGVEKIEQETQLVDEGIAAYRRQAEIQETDLVERTPLTNRPTEAILTAKDNETAAYEFEKGYAEAARIEDPTERLEAEKALVDALSDDNRRFVEFSTEHFHVFEEGYFDALGGAEMPEQTARAPAIPGPDMSG